MKKTSFFTKYLGLGCLLKLGFIACVLAVVFLIGTRISNYEKTHNTTIIQEIGKGTRKVSDEFNKGFKSDTLVIDTLKTK